MIIIIHGFKTQEDINTWVSCLNSCAITYEMQDFFEKENSTGQYIDGLFKSDAESDALYKVNYARNEEV